jgi:hypothetical protein
LIARDVSFDSGIEWVRIFAPEMSPPATALPPPSAINRASDAMIVAGCLKVFTTNPPVEWAAPTK